MPGPADILSILTSLHRVADKPGVDALVHRLAARERPTVLSFVNAHAVNLCMASDRTLDAFRQADILLRDGVGLKAALAALGCPPGLNMNGTDFIPQLLAALPAQRLAVYGTASPWLERGVEVLRRRTPHAVIDTDHGFHPLERYVEAAVSLKPDIVLLAMGMPRQEILAAEMKAALSHPALIVNGGAIVDFFAGRVRRAPPALRHLGLEWTYRLAHEPKRLFNRYCVGGFAFARTVVRVRRSARGAVLPVFEEP